MSRNDETYHNIRQLRFKLGRRMTFSRGIILISFLALALSCKVVTFVHAGEEAVTTTEAKKAPETLALPEIEKKLRVSGNGSSLSS